MISGLSGGCVNKRVQSIDTQFIFSSFVIQLKFCFVAAVLYLLLVQIVHIGLGQLQITIIMSAVLTYTCVLTVADMEDMQAVD